MQQTRHPNALYCAHNDFFHTEEHCTVEECKQTNLAKRQVVALEEANRLKRIEMDRPAPDKTESYRNPPMFDRKPPDVRFVMPEKPQRKGGINVDPRE